MKKCIIQYQEHEHDCFCGELRECEKCSTGSNRKENDCIITINGYCTCRGCGRAVRSDGYCHQEKKD